MQMNLRSATATLQWYTGQIRTVENVKFVEHENTNAF